MNERRRKSRISIRLTSTQWAVIVEALGQMVKAHATQLDSLVRQNEAGAAGNLSAFDALSRTYADLLRELSEAGLIDGSARATAGDLDAAFALLESRVLGGTRQ